MSHSILVVLEDEDGVPFGNLDIGHSDELPTSFKWGSRLFVITNNLGGGGLLPHYKEIVGRHIVPGSAQLVTPYSEGTLI